MAEVLTSFAGTEIYARLLQQPKEALAQRVLVGLDLIHGLRTQQKQMDTTDGMELGELQDELSYAQARIIELEGMLTEAKDQIQRLVEGDSVEWSIV